MSLASRVKELRRFAKGLIVSITLVGGVLALSHAAIAGETFVGTADENPDLFVAVVTDGDRVTAFACDGKGDLSVLWVWGWFDGTVEEGRTGLVSTNGLLLQLEPGEDGWTGVLVTRDNERLAFELEPATEDAGLYRYQGEWEGARVLAGWVFLNSGEWRGAIIRDGAGVNDESVARLLDEGGDSFRPIIVLPD